MFYFFALFILFGMSASFLLMFARSKLKDMTERLDKTEAHVKAIDANVKVTRDLLGQVFTKVDAKGISGA